MEQYNECKTVPEYHALLTIQLGQLIEGKSFSWSDEPLASAMNGLIYEKDGVLIEDDKTRLQDMFNEKFYWREISITPPARWRQMLIYKLKYELVPKYKPLYKAIREGDINTLVSGSEYYKERIINSDFPETALAASSQVYASTGEDREYEKLAVNDAMNLLDNYYNRFINVDTAFMRELEIFFTDMYALHENLL